MSDEFDPYYKWLAIPPKLQPPNHYRLLGVELFETDLDVIDAAANQRMAYVQGLASGEHGELSQKLLNELAAARVCLTDVEEKAAYDATLKDQPEATKEKPKQADHQTPDDEEPSREAVEDASRQTHDDPTPPPTPIAPPKAEPPSAAIAVAAPNAQTPPPPPPSNAVDHERAGSEPPAIDSGATGPPPVAAKRPIETTVPVVKPSEGKPPYRAGQRRQDRGNPALIVAGSAVAVLTLLGAIYVATGQWRKAPAVTQATTTPDRRSQRPSRTDEPSMPAQSVPPKPKEQPNEHVPAAGPATDFAAPKPKLQNERLLSKGAPVTEAMAAMADGNVDQALIHLEQVLQSGNTQNVTWARQLLDQIDIASSDYRAQKLLEQLSDEQLEQLAEGKIEAQVEGDLDYRVLRQRFKETVRQNVPVVLERRRKIPSEAKGATPDRPNSPGDTAASDDGMQAKPKPAQPKQMDLDPAALLKKRGLTKRDEYWVLEGDDDLKEGVAHLARQERDYNGAYGALREIVTAYGNARRQLAAAERNGQPALVTQARIAGITAGRRCRGSLMNYMKARSDFTVAYLRTANRAEELLRRYHEFEDDPDVQIALGQLAAASNTLGPTPVFRQNQGHIRQHEGELLRDTTLGVFGDDDGEDLHVHVIVNERASELLAYRSNAKFNLVPEQVLRTAGVETESERKARLNIGGVEFSANMIVIPSLRIGNIVSRNVEAYVLPPDKAGLQGFLRDDAFPDHRIDVKSDGIVATVRAIRRNELEPRIRN